MIEAIGLAGTDHRQLISVPRDMRIPVRHPQTALAMLIPFALGRHERVARGAHGSNWAAKGFRHGLPRKFVQRWFGIEQVEVARPAFHEQPNDGLGFGGMVGLLGGQRVQAFRGQRLR